YQELAEQSLQNGGYTVTTTVNQTVYDAMQKAVTDYNGLMQDGTGTIQTGNVLMDNKTGAVYGFIEGLDFSQSQVNHAF
ncbi:hypothetical protein RLL94_00525, partial [Streptococcus pneumoniae]|nr:hypothetical protein [Streptococcus pneumoniae]